MGNVQLSGDQIKTILGKQQNAPAPKKKVKLSNNPNDDIDADDAKDLIAKSGMHNAYAPAMTSAIDKTGMLTPDQGDVVRKLRDARTKQKASEAAAMKAATKKY